MDEIRDGNIEEKLLISKYGAVEINLIPGINEYEKKQKTIFVRRHVSTRDWIWCDQLSDH